MVNCLGIPWLSFLPKRSTHISASSCVCLKQALSLTQILVPFTAHPLTQQNKQSSTVQSSSTVAAGCVWSMWTHADTLLCAHRRCLPYLKFVRGTGWERKHWTQLFIMLKLVTKVRGPYSALMLDPAACTTTLLTQFGTHCKLWPELASCFAAAASTAAMEVGCVMFAGPRCCHL